MHFSMKFNVWLKWLDDRLQYQNLNQNKYWNSIPTDMSVLLWKPLLIFENNDQRRILKYDSLSSVMMLLRNGHARENSVTEPEEARLYNSNETEIVLRTLHFMRFKCDFDLHYFPFDEQTCYTEVSRLEFLLEQTHLATTLHSYL